MPGGFGQMPMGGQMPGEFGQMPNFDESPTDVPAGSPAATSQGWFDPQMQGNPGMGGPMGFGNPGMGAPHGQMPYGYPQMGASSPQVMGAQDLDMGMNPAGGQMPFMQQPFPYQGGLPVGTGALGDCGCGGPAQAAIQPNFVPPTPPIYSAPYTGPVNVAQPPYMNPYGMGPRYDDESNEYDF